MRIRTLASAGLAVLAVAAVPATASATAPLPAPAKAKAKAAQPVATAAAAGCTRNGPTVTDFRGYRFATRYCHNYKAGYTFAENLTTHDGYLYAGDNWFVCQARGGENPPVGSARNNIWLYTQGDVGYLNRGWGWFPATYVSGGVNYGPIPGLRWC